VHAELQAKGKKIGKNRVAKLMQKTCLRIKQKRPFWHTTNSKHKDPIAPNILKRDFTPKAPNQAWATDVTYVHTGEGCLYLAVMLDLFSRRVVGWTASATHDPALALSALERALAARKPAPGLVHHSDRGAPYASAVYRQKLLAHGLVPRMSRSGDCWDNAVAESFFSFAQGRAGSSRALPDSCCRSCVDRRLHQQFLQPAPPALASQLSQPCRVRITSTNHRPCRMVQVSTESGELHS